MPPEFKIASLKIIMLNHAERFDAISKAVMAMGATGDARVKEIIDQIRDFAAELRMRNVKPNASPFVDGVNAHESHECHEEDADQEAWTFTDSNDWY